MPTLAETEELAQLMRQIVTHATRVDGLAYQLDDVTLHHRFHPSSGSWSWSASVGKHEGYRSTEKKDALNALLGVLGSR